MINRPAAQPFSALRPGATWDAQTALSPIISAPQAARILDIVERARTAGAQVRCGGGLFEGGPGGAYFQPTLLRGVLADNPAVQEDTFDTEDEGLALAAHAHCGLAAGVHTADIGRALRCMRGISAGTVWINRYGCSADFVIPTGGYHQSGHWQ